MNKTEMKEDMMNRISFALKDPVLQMGFEAICSKLSRLEKENVEMKKQLTKAKEVIENLIDSLMAIDGEQIRELSVVKEAEQFLKESE